MFDINDFNEYKIKRETIEAIAEKLRVMVGKTAKLTTEEIIYWLGRVKFTPQGQIESNVKNCDYIANCIGLIPNYEHSTIESNINLTHNLFSSSCKGQIPDYDYSMIESALQDFIYTITVE